MVQERLVKISGGKRKRHVEADDSARFSALGIGVAAPASGIVDISGHVEVGSGTKALNGELRLPYASSINSKCYDTTDQYATCTSHAVFNSTTDDIGNWGYNVTALGGRLNGSKHTVHFQIESDYNNGAQHLAEIFAQYVDATGANVRRPFGAVIDLATHAAATSIVGNSIYFNLDNATQLMKLSAGLMLMNVNAFLWTGTCTAPKISHTTYDLGEGITGKALTIESQGNTNVVAGTGGPVQILFGDGVTAAGSVKLGKTGGITKFQVHDDRNEHHVPAKLKSYTVAGLAGLSPSAGWVAWCSNETGGAVQVNYDGSDWRRVYDNVIASAA